MFVLADTENQGAIIKVVGVGGGGGNAVTHMVNSGIEGVDFVCINTDAQALKHSKVKTSLQIGSNITKGLGAGANPEVGRQAAMEDREHFEQTRQAVIRSREALVRELAALGFEVLPSAANFIFARHPRHDAAQLALALREQSIIVRHFKLPRIDQFLRITVGTDGECKALTAALHAIIS